MKYALDGCAMIALFRNEAGAKVVEELINDKCNKCYAHAINLIEVYYHVARDHGETIADQVLEYLESIGIIVSRDIDQLFVEQVGKLKTRGRISLADCFCIALAQRIGGTVVTSDHHEFDALVSLGIVPILFIR